MSERVPAIGIDLGTTYSVIAQLDAQGRPRTIPNAEGDNTTPSVVLFDAATVVVGKEAVKSLAIEPDNVATCVKREMGSTAYSKPIRGRFLPPEVIQSFLLKKLKDDAELELGAVKQVVITVPAYYNEPRRKATQDAARLAGLEAIELINEPTAAAIAYGVQQGFLSPEGRAAERQRILVYDLGGGTFDVTVMEIHGARYTTIATAGDVHLGGIDWDQRIAQWLAARFAEQTGSDPRQDPAAIQHFLRQAEELKRSLTPRMDVPVKFEHHGQVLQTTFSRAKFEELTVDLLERTRLTMRNVLREARLKWGDIQRLVLTGGSTRMPMIQQMLKQESGLTIDRSLSADEAVAHGAAIYAGFLLARQEPKSKPLAIDKVIDVNSHDLGVLGIEQATGRPRCQVLIPRNTALPATRASRFVTRKPGQRSVAVRIVEGGDRSGRHSTPIGKCVVSDLPPGLPAGTPVNVVFSYLENGRIAVEAALPDLGRSAKLVIERASGLTEPMLQKWQADIATGLTFEPVKIAKVLQPGLEYELLDDLEPVDDAPSAPAGATDAPWDFVGSGERALAQPEDGLDWDELLDQG